MEKFWDCIFTHIRQLRGGDNVFTVLRSCHAQSCDGAIFTIRTGSPCSAPFLLGYTEIFYEIRPVHYIECILLLKFSEITPGTVIMNLSYVYR